MTPLPPHDIQLLGRVQAHLAAGRIGEANAEIVRISPAGSSHPDALFVAAGLLRAQGLLVQARHALEGAVQLVPGNPHYWNALANLLAATGETGGAGQAYRNAISLAPGNADFRINLALSHAAAGHGEECEAALAEAERIDPRSARLWSVRGSLSLDAGQAGSAASHLGRALQIDPLSNDARHNLALALRQLDRVDEALEQVETALANGGTRDETPTLRGHLLADLGQMEDAVIQYEAVVSRNPEAIEAQDQLCRLLPQLGRDAEAFVYFQEALAARPAAHALWSAAILAAKELKDFERLLDWSERAIRQFGAEPDFCVAHAIGQAMSGRHVEAVSELESAAKRHPDSVGISNHLVPSLLAVGDLEAAERWALRSTELAPHDQSGWAWLTVIWRMRGDAREAWLADYDRFVLPIALDPPPGFATAQDFLARLDEVLTALHVGRAHPADQSLRHGTQTRGNLFDRKIDEIQALANGLKRQIESRLRTLPAQEGHPFLGRIGSGRIRFAASWSVRLASSGFHINHVHPTGWLSSAFYVSLPPEVGEAGTQAGALAFGVPDSTLGLHLAPRRIVHPEAGKLVLFPSYFWHGTIPFESRTPRLTVAFDTQPLENQASAGGRRTI